jgi:hypothetical protein
MYKITLEFETKEDAEVWKSGYIDQCEQHLEFYTDLQNSSEDNLILKGYGQCPSCRYPNMDLMASYIERWQDVIKIDKEFRVKDKTNTHKCSNCMYECDLLE